MKKIISALMAVSLSAMPLNTFTARAEDKKVQTLVILGDSIASGYGLSSDEYNYGQICGDYLGCNVANFAVPGATTVDMLNAVSNMSAEQSQVLSSADAVVISIGGNDMMNYFSEWILDYASENNFLNEGYTKSDIPESPTISTLLQMINITGEGGIKEYFETDNTAMFALNTQMRSIVRNMCNTTGANEGFIHNKVMVNIGESVSRIQQLNPDTRIIVQTVYNPLQLPQDYLISSYGKNYSDMISYLRGSFDTVLSTYKTELSAIDGIEVADVYAEFTSLGEGVVSTDSNPGHSYYFTSMQNPLHPAENQKGKDFHPNQKGHLAIASTVLKTIGQLHNDSGLLYKVYSSIQDKSDYPEVAYSTYKAVLGEEPKQEETTTTTETTATTTTTTETKDTVTTSVTTEPKVPERKLTKGDVNGDGGVNSIDASLVMVEYAKSSSHDTEGRMSDEEFEAGDVNVDGAVNSIDASLIMGYYTYLSSDPTRAGTTFEQFIEYSKTLSK